MKFSEASKPLFIDFVLFQEIINQEFFFPRMTVEVNHLLFVPIEKGDWLGHADGMSRFIANDTF
jgi:hypothetical protein